MIIYLVVTRPSEMTSKFIESSNLTFRHLKRKSIKGNILRNKGEKIILKSPKKSLAFLLIL